MSNRSQQAVVSLAPFQVPEETTYGVTSSGMTSRWTPAGKEYLSQAADFCACTRLIVDRLIREVPYSKAELTKRYDFSSRMVNSVEVCAQGDFQSLEKTKVLALTNAKAKYWTAIDKYVAGFLEGMTEAEAQRRISRIAKWSRQVKRQEANQAQPRYFPGQDVFEQQHLMKPEEFQKAYALDRSNRICSVGSWDEPPCCNSELQVRFAGYLTSDLVTTGYQFQLVHSRQELCTFKLDRKEGSLLLERILQNQVPYHYQAAFRDLTKAERNQGKYGYDPAFIGPINISYLKKVREPYYVPLTVTLLRDKKKPKRWQVRVSWLEQGQKPFEVGNTFLSYDINNDSLAYTLFRIQDGKIELLFKHEPKFDTKTNKAADRLRLLHKELNTLFELALRYQACIVGEALKWEGAKVGFSAISKTLHDIPYATIREAIVRKGLQKGVPLRFINPAFTSILGGLFTDLNRDEAAALVIGLKGSLQGIELLEALCQNIYTQILLQAEGVRYKVEVKHRFSESVKVRDVSARQLGSQPETGDKAATAFTYRLARLLKEVIKGRKRLHHRRKTGASLPMMVVLDDRPTARPSPETRTEPSALSDQAQVITLSA